MKYNNKDRSALQNFKCCHNRVRDGKVSCIHWPRTSEGYDNFLEHIGKKPNDGQKWSVGRINHNLGYIPGNIRWEVHKFNSVKRRGTKFEHSEDPSVELRKIKFRKGTKEWLEHQKRIAQEYWSDPDHRAQRSEKLKQLWKDGAFEKRGRK
jgi:hypothetical protein